MRSEWQGKTAAGNGTPAPSGAWDKAMAGGAWAGGKFTDLVGWALDKGMTWALAAPAVVGVGAGMAASGLTSPTESDMKSMEKQMVLAEQQRLSAALRRQLALSRRRRRMVGMDEIDAPGVDVELGESPYRDVLR